MSNISSDNNTKGGLIKKKNTLQRPAPIKFNDPNPFKYSQPEEKKIVKPTENEKPMKAKESNIANQGVKARVGKSNAVKSIKVPLDIHTKIHILGKFLDENKTYAILDKLIESYVQSNLTDRQQKQFNFMTEFMQEEN